MSSLAVSPLEWPLQSSPSTDSGTFPQVRIYHFTSHLFLRVLSPADLVYVILFPQLVCVVHYKRYCNTYGSLAAYLVGFFLRAGGGEPILGLPPTIKYPGYSEVEGQLFPFRTFSMLSSFATLLGVTWFSKWIFEAGRLSAGYDIFHCVVNIPDDVCVVQDPHEEMTILSTSQALYYQTSEINGRINPALDAEDDATTEKLLPKGANSRSSPPSVNNGNGNPFLAKGSIPNQAVSSIRAMAGNRANSMPNSVSPVKAINQSTVSQRKPPTPAIESVNPGQVIITKL